MTVARWMWVVVAIALSACGSVWADPIVTSTAGGGSASGTAGTADGDAPSGSGGVPPPTASWCDAATWPDGAVPTAGTDVVVESGQRVLIDCDAEARTIEVRADGELFASRHISTTLTIHGNLVNYGRLDWGRPDDRIEDVGAQIVFADVDDDLFVGTPPAVVGSDFGPTQLTPIAVEPNDTGLWVLGDGELFAAGREVRSWGFLLDGVGPGDAQLQIDDATGWRVGDRVVLTATASSSVPEFDAQAEEAAISEIDGNTVTLAGLPTYAHAGCAGCQRRGEAALLGRNVVIRSADASGHAHVLVAESGRVGLDGVELRWLGPAWPSPRCGHPSRRAPLYFHQQHEESRGSFVRHVSIWGGASGSITVERSSGIVIDDVVAYASDGRAFVITVDTAACGARCTDDTEVAPRDVVFEHALAIAIGVVPRSDDCAPIAHRHAAFVLGGGDGTGCRACIATGIAAGPSSGADASGFHWPERGGSTTIFEDCGAHNADAHGIFMWHVTEEPRGPFARINLWSLGKSGISFSGRSTPARFTGATIFDTAAASVLVASVGTDKQSPLIASLVDRLEVGTPIAPHSRPFEVSGVQFSGAVSPAVTNRQQDCQGGDPDDPNDDACPRAWLRLVDPEFFADAVPFSFGTPVNRNTVWEIRGFQHPSYPDLPADFDLYRADAGIAGGQPAPEFDALLVPR